MGLLDNLFKPKPDADGDKSVESSGTAENAEQQAAGASSQKGSPFRAPKIYIPRSSVQIVPPTRSHLEGERKLAPVADSPRGPMQIVLTLGDVFSRIPTHFLRQGVPDLRRELKFPAEGLAADIARGRAAVFLADIIAQCPDVFLPEAEGFDDVQIRLPLQKLVEQIGLGPVNSAPILAPAPAPSAAESAASQPPSPPSAKVADAPPGEEQIHLSLAVIMKRCPREIIVQPLPPIDESVRITFPFAPIERQLSTGQVEVSSLRFIAALPIGLMKCFEARAGVKVPLPLEEIFQNLPNQAPPPAIETRFHATPAPPIASPETTDLARENARLAEAILLEAMFEPVEHAEPHSHEPAPAAPFIAENIVINANFTPEPAITLIPPPIQRAGEALFQAPPAAVPEPPVAEETMPTPASIKAGFDAPLREMLAENEKTDAADDLAAQLEALAAEDAKLESQLASEAATEEPQTPPADEVPPSIAAILPEPVALPVEAPLLRRFVPVLRPPVILQPKAGGEELRPMPGASAQSEPAAVVPEPEREPVQVPVGVPSEMPRPPHPFQPPPESIVPAPESFAPATLPVPPPASPIQRPTGPSVAEPILPDPAVESPGPVAPTPAPFTDNPPPVVAGPSISTLHIGPPQFRPFIVQAPPIIFAPTDMAATAPQSPVESPAPEPVISASALPEPVVEIAPEPAVEMLPVNPEPQPEAASPVLLDGSVRAFFASDAPLALPRVSQLLAALPGIQGCILVTRFAESHGGELPAGLDPSAIRDLSQRMRGALSDHAETFNAGQMQHLTLHAEHYSLSLFTRGEACVCAVHRARIFLPGVRERFSAVAEELARAGH